MTNLQKALQFIETAEDSEFETLRQAVRTRHNRQIAEQAALYSLTEEEKEILAKVRVFELPNTEQINVCVEVRHRLKIPFEVAKKMVEDEIKRR